MNKETLAELNEEIRKEVCVFGGELCKKYGGFCPSEIKEVRPECVELD